MFPSFKDTLTSPQNIAYNVETSKIYKQYILLISGASEVAEKQ
jgi:hypothetical protein